MAADCLLTQQKSMVSGIKSELRTGKKRIDAGKRGFVVMSAELGDRLFAEAILLNIKSG